MATNILLVDDSLVAAQQMKGVLAGFPEYEVVGHAKNGAEGLKLYAQLRPDVVMLDLVMPIMDGLQAMRALHGINSDVRVVVVSSVGGVESKLTEALRLGARAVITKPIDADEVKAALTQALAAGES